MFKEAHQGEVRKEASEREEPRASIIKTKGKKASIGNKSTPQHISLET